LQTALAVADDAPIGGDFIVFDAPRGGERLQAVVVDTSGKGADAATRSVMLAGAIAGLLGEVPTEALIPAVNRHILRLDWDEHFATATHLDLDLVTGAYQLAVAGHPATVHLQAGSGQWRSLPATGPALGFLPDAAWTRYRGVVAPGDALVVVTDGVVEVPGRDLDVGFDRMLGEAERLVLAGFDGGASRLLNTRPAAVRDDAQVLLITRTGVRRTAQPSGPPRQRADGLDPYQAASVDRTRDLTTG
jgi:serine phosphatase RsbU (regulator of sigma subunit)